MEWWRGFAAAVASPPAPEGFRLNSYKGRSLIRPDKRRIFAWRSDLS
jgi:hypothetical protein